MSRKRQATDTNAERNLDRLQRKALSEQEKRKKPGECLKYIKAIIDQQLVHETMGSKILTHLDTMKVKYELRQQIISRTIHWQRCVQQTFVSTTNEVQLTDRFNDEEHLVRIMTAAELNELVKTNSLKSHIECIEQNFTGKRITVIVHAIKEYCRVVNTRNVGRLAFETAITEMQLQKGVCFRLLDTPEDIGVVISQMTKSIAEIPYKRDKMERNADHNFYLANDNKDCVQVKGEVGLSSLWQRHLMKIPSVTLESAEAIINEYVSPSKLIAAYDSHDVNGPLLLADIPIRRAAGSLSAARKIGAEISKKIHALYTNTNSNYVI